MIRRLAIAFGILLFGTFAHSASAAEAKLAKSKDPAREVVDAVLRKEMFAPVDRRAELSAALEKHADSAALRWQAGYVRHGKVWQRVEQAGQLSAEDSLLTDYRARRADAPKTPQGQLALADWCRKKQLPDQELAHLRAVMDLTPNEDHTAILERLGNIQVGNTWLSREQMEHWQIQNRRNLAAFKHWGPRLEKLADRIDGSRGQHDTAVASLKHLTDPEVIPVVECALCGRDEPCAAAAVETFARMEGFEATLALARQAVFSNWRAVREEATKPLKGRKYEDFIPPLISLLATPLTRIVAPQRWYYCDCPDSPGRAGQFVIASGYVLARETEDQFQVAVMHQLDYSLTTALQGNFVRFRGGFHLEPETTKDVSPVTKSTRIRTGLDNGRITAAETYQKERLVETMEAAVNERTDELNRRVISVLASVTENDPSPDPGTWWRWWGNFTDTQLVGGKQVVTVAEDTEVLGDPTLRIRRRSCFAAGTPVWTESGQTPIETIQIGDRVLAQNVETGELTYKPVVCTTVRPVKPLVSLKIGEESLTATSGHRFWVAGDGWTKARDLKPGGLVHTVTGNATIEAVETGPTAETYNLVVADYHDYFVGRSGILVQDLPMPQPTNAIVPGLAPHQRHSTAAK